MIVEFIDEILMFFFGIFSLFVGRSARLGLIADRMEKGQRDNLARMLIIIGPAMMAGSIVMAIVKILVPSYR